MSHTIENKARLIARVRRLVGQAAAIERALEAEAPCVEILHLAASVRGATNGLVLDLLEDHLASHVLEAQGEAARADGAREMVEVMRTYLK